KPGSAGRCGPARRSMRARLSRSISSGGSPKRASKVSPDTAASARIRQLLSRGGGALDESARQPPAATGGEMNVEIRGQGLASREPFRLRLAIVDHIR